MRAAYGGLASSALFVLLQGCAIHPIPDDVTRDSTVDIVKKIRCEARRAIERHPDRKYDRAGIAYEFKFTITENSKASGSALFALPFTSGKFTLALGAGEDRARAGERNFQIVETFDELKAEDCSQHALGANWKYPITGVVGLEEVIDTFLKLANMGLLEQAGKVASFTDTIEFVTTFRGNVDPKIELNPVSDRLKLTEAKASLSADRTDKHKLTVSLALPVPTRVGAGEGTRSFRGVAGDGSAKSRALLGLERQRTLDTQEKILDILRSAPID